MGAKEDQRIRDYADSGSPQCEQLQIHPPDRERVEGRLLTVQVD